MALMGMKAIHVGLVRAELTVLLTAPVRAPATGPARPATRTVPRESR